MSTTVSSSAAKRRLRDAGALADPLVGGVDALDDLGVGHDPRRAVAADAEDARVRGAAWRERMRCGHAGHRLGVQSDERLAGRDRVTVLDEPLDDAYRRAGRRPAARRAR